MDEALPAILLETAARVLAANRAIGKRIVLAESCTGGLVTAALTAIAGSSDVLECGFVTYSNESKMRMLGVDATLLETFGAVSIATAWSMAQGALDRSAADVAVSITGIAGPDGGCAQSRLARWSLHARAAVRRPRILLPISNSLATLAAPKSGFRRRWSRSSC